MIPIDHEFKRAAKNALAAFSSVVEDKRCFVLDGSNAATIAALQGNRGLVMAPNVDLETVSVL